MVSNLKKVVAVGLWMAVFILWPAGSRAAPDYQPTNDGGNFGLGLELGDPGVWGVDGKIWIDQTNAFQPAVKFSDGGSGVLQLDYLWHNFDVVRLKDGGQMPFYIGVGGDFILQSASSLAVRVPLGLSYIFEKKDVPIDIYFQLVPTIWFFNAGSEFDLYPELGGRFYL